MSMEGQSMPSATAEETQRMEMNGHGRPSKIKIRPPQDFTGAQEEVCDFAQDSKMYLILNDGVYNTNKKKILFLLSYMRGGTAGPWKRNFLEKMTKDKTGAKIFPTFKDFCNQLNAAFLLADKVGDVKSKLKTIEMRGGKTTDDYNRKFQNAAAHSGITEDAALIEYYINGLPAALYEKVSNLENYPTTIEGWYKKTAFHDSRYRHMKAIAERI